MDLYAMGNLIAQKRRERNLTQEGLASLIGVSNKTVSKWETGKCAPDYSVVEPLCEQLGITIAELFGAEFKNETGNSEEKAESTENAPSLSRFLGINFSEKKSSRTFRGLPLYHIGKKARGIVAIGFDAKGVIAIGILARGLISVGALSFGLVFSVGFLAIGILASIGLFSLSIAAEGCIAVGLMAIGAIAVGVLSSGAVAVGGFAIGALAIGKFFALGDHARGMVAIGITKAAGELFEKVGNSLTHEEFHIVSDILREEVPLIFQPIVEMIIKNVL